MRCASIFTAVSLAGGLLVAGSLLSAAESKPAAASSENSQTEKKPGKPVLERGMDAEAVVRLFGKPDSVKPMKSPEGKAETWTYRRLLSKHMGQSATGVREVPGFDGSVGANAGKRTEIVYRNVYTEIFQVTQILLYNDKVVVAKQWKEQEQSYD